MRSVHKELENLSQNHLLRSLRWIDETEGLKIKIDGQTYVDFSSNDYLGLSQHPEAKEAMLQAVKTCGVGSRASRLITGSQAHHRELEDFLAEKKQTEAALTFSSGYATATGTICSLLEKGDLVVLDKLCHASLIDGARLSGATLKRFSHNDMVALQKILESFNSQRKPKQRVLIVTESVFSMDGDCCPLEELIKLKERFDSLLMLDEAHGLGVLGQSGLGLAEQKGLQHKVDLQMGTLSKAVGCSGGYLAASKNIINLLINKARSFIYSTAPPAPIAAAALQNLQIITSPEGNTLRKKLFHNKKLLNSNGEREASPSAIIPIPIGQSESALKASEYLKEHGFIIPAIRYPTVPPNTARLRITLSARHSEEQISKLKQLILQYQPAV